MPEVTHLVGKVFEMDDEIVVDETRMAEVEEGHPVRIRPVNARYRPVEQESDEFGERHVVPSAAAVAEDAVLRRYVIMTVQSDYPSAVSMLEVVGKAIAERELVDVGGHEALDRVSDDEELPQRRPRVLQPTRVVVDQVVEREDADRSQPAARMDRVGGGGPVGGGGTGSVDASGHESHRQLDGRSGHFRNGTVENSTGFVDEYTVQTASALARGYSVNRRLLGATKRRTRLQHQSRPIDLK